MKKMFTCLLAMSWLWTASGQRVGDPSIRPQESKKIQSVLSFENGGEIPDAQLSRLLHPGKDQVFLKSRIKKDKSGVFETEIYDLHYKGIKVEGAEIRVLKRRGKPVYVLQDYMPINQEGSVKPKLSVGQALNKLVSRWSNKKFAWQDVQMEKSLKDRNQDPTATYLPKGELVYLPEEPCIAYKFEVFTLQPFQKEEVFVNAITGSFVKSHPLFNRDHGTEMFDAYSKTTNRLKLNNNNLQTADLWVKVNGVDRTSVGSYDSQASHFYLNDIAGKIHTLGLESIDNSFNPLGAKTEFASPFNIGGIGDFRTFEGSYEIATRVHYGLEYAYSYFLSKHSRLGYDNMHSPLSSYVLKLKNIGSFYDRGESLFFTYDDGMIEPEIKVSPNLETVYHEYAHAVTVSESGLLAGSNESGSLNEGLSDIWAYTLADQHLKQNPYQGNYDVEEQVYNALNGNDWKTTAGNDEFQEYFQKMNGYSIVRDAQNPNSNNYPDFYKGSYWNSHPDDEHVNSTIISHWYFLLTEGGTKTLENDPSVTVNINGIGMDKAAEIIYFTTTHFLGRYTNFYQFALQTSLAARAIFGENSQELLSVNEAWKAVGLEPIWSSLCPCTPPADYQSNFYVSKFSLANIQNEKNEDFQGGYRDYTYLTIATKSNYEYELLLKAAAIPYETLPPTSYWTVWVDVNRNDQFEAGENIFSGQGNSIKGAITIPPLLKGTKTILRVILSANPIWEGCYDQIANKSPLYMEDYTIEVGEYCPIQNWTSDDFKKDKPKFQGLAFKKLSLLECGKDTIAKANPALQQKEVDWSQVTLKGGQNYSLAFSLFPQEGVQLYPNASYENKFSTNCVTEYPFGFEMYSTKSSLKEAEESKNDNSFGLGCDDPTIDPTCLSRILRLVWIDFNRDGYFEMEEGFSALYDVQQKNYFLNFKVPNWASTIDGLSKIRIYVYLGNRALLSGTACGNGINGHEKFNGDPVLSKNGIDILVNLKKDSYYMKMSDPVAEKPAPSDDQSNVEPVSLTVYPNPANNWVDLSLKGAIADNFTLEIYNADGMRLLLKPWDGRSIDVSSYPPGLYLITLKRDREIYSQKLMIQR